MHELRDTKETRRIAPNDTGEKRRINKSRNSPCYRKAKAEEQRKNTRRQKSVDRQGKNRSAQKQKKDRVVVKGASAFRGSQPSDTPTSRDSPRKGVAPKAQKKRGSLQSTTTDGEDGNTFAVG